MTNYVKRVKAVGIYGRFDLEEEFQPGVNILYGKNGAGKTTLLHILANVLNGDYRQFAFLEFRSINVELDEEVTVKITRTESIAVDETPSDRLARHRTDRIDVSVNGVLLGSFSVDDVSQQRQEQREAFTYGRFSALPESQFEDSHPLIAVAYFPAFRAMLDAWAVNQGNRGVQSSRKLIRAQATNLARQGLGEFVPSISYPSLAQIDQGLSREIRDALTELANTEQKLVSLAFLQILESVLQEPTQTLESPSSILDAFTSLLDEMEQSPLRIELVTLSEVYSHFRKLIGELRLTSGLSVVAISVLSIYKEVLERTFRALQNGFRNVQRYFDCVNSFLERKRLVSLDEPFRSGRTMVGVCFDNGVTMRGLHSLSSGERQIAALMYAAAHMSEQKVVLIDEPEISLHPDWQRKLLVQMAHELSERQIIACTHSPMIGAKYRELIHELVLTPTEEPQAPDDTEEEIPF